jgi:hypothetical protein
VKTRYFRLTLAATAASVIALTGAAGALASTPASSAAPTAYSGCVKYLGTPARVLWNVHTAPVTCPAGSFAVHWNQAGPQGPAGPQGIQGIQGPPGPSDLSVTATTSVSGRDDSGGDGNWATDAFIRMITITRHEAAAVSNCGGGVAACWFYTGTITDSGTFQTQAGAETPNQGYAGPDTIAGIVSGNFTGGSHIEFYASSSAPNAGLVPSTISGDLPSTSAWYQKFFSGSTVFSGPANLIDWSWSYSAPATCEHWTDAAGNGAGQGTALADGDITGVNHCT